MHVEMIGLSLTGNYQRQPQGSEDWRDCKSLINGLRQIVDIPGIQYSNLRPMFIAHRLTASKKERPVLCVQLSGGGFRVRRPADILSGIAQTRACILHNDLRCKASMIRGDVLATVFFL